MKIVQKIAFATLIFIIILSCNDDNTIITLEPESKIVVEGWIETGDVPQVIVSRTVPINTVLNNSNAMNYVIRSAKVTVSDGVQEEILSLKTSSDRIPPYIYYGDKIIGEEGKTYTLKVEFLNRNITAITNIPPSVNITSVQYEKQQVTDTIGYAHINFVDPISQKNYYQIATRIDKQETVFTPAFYGNLDDRNFNSPNVFLKINKGISIYPKSSFEPYFSTNKVVYIKLRTMNKDAFDFWNSWQNEIANGQNPVFPSSISLKSNVKGGIGIWAGYGQNTLLLQTK